MEEINTKRTIEEELKNIISEIKKNMKLLSTVKGNKQKELFVSINIILSLKDLIDHIVVGNKSKELFSQIEPLNKSFIYSDKINEVIEDIKDDNISWNYAIPVLSIR